MTAMTSSTGRLFGERKTPKYNRWDTKESRERRGEKYRPRSAPDPGPLSLTMEIPPGPTAVAIPTIVSELLSMIKLKEIKRNQPAKEIDWLAKNNSS
jgi:hypothetical protein